MFGACFCCFYFHLCWCLANVPPVDWFRNLSSGFHQIISHLILVTSKCNKLYSIRGISKWYMGYDGYGPFNTLGSLSIILTRNPSNLENPPFTADFPLQIPFIAMEVAIEVAMEQSWYRMRSRVSEVQNGRGRDLRLSAAQWPAGSGHRADVALLAAGTNAVAAQQAAPWRDAPREIEVKTHMKATKITEIHGI